MSYEHLAWTVVEWAVANGQSHRIVSVDLETKVLSHAEFLTGEAILSFAMARRVDGNIESRLFTLESETSESQQALLTRVNHEIERIRPLIALGYNITGYDFPLLRVKLGQSSSPHWALIDMVERSFVLDMKHPLRFELARADGASPKIRTLEDVVNHPRFARLPLSRTKNLLNGLDRTQRGERIYNMWKERKDDFGKYATGDVVDVLILFEALFQMKETIATARSE